MKIKTATITFHSPHNYGSMLQAYSLQQTLFKLGYNNDIINLRTERQIAYYRDLLDVRVKSLRSLVKYISILPYKKDIQAKYDLFEKFLAENLKTTAEFKTLEEIAQANLSYDCYISGGDQIWNTSPLDFDWSYYLPFVKEGKRISYGVSMGPKGQEQVKDIEKVKQLLSKYAHLSVREEGTAEVVRSMIDQPVSIELDTAMLLSGDEWKTKYDNKPIIDGDYILLYVPGFKKPIYDMAAYLSKKLKMKVVVTLFNTRNYQYNFRSQLATGPWEFLNLTQHARLVVSGSFHALVFATLFHVPFFAVNGDKDNRMVTFLKSMNLLDRTINETDCDSKLRHALITDYTAADQYLNRRRKECLSYLKNSIEN